MALDQTRATKPPGEAMAKSRTRNLSRAQVQEKEMANQPEAFAVIPRDQRRREDGALQ
jgi:hypothetical protein